MSRSREPPGDPLAVLAAQPAVAWLVGGAVRDRLLGQGTTDLDVVVDGDPGSLAREVARRSGGHPFALSETFGGWRVVAHDRRWQLDLTPLAAPDIEADLAQRDFTINALAQRLGDDAAELIDPFGGRVDLAARRLRAVGGDAFERDPLRVLRLARFACQLDFTVDPDTVALGRAAAFRLATVAPERVFAELRLIIVHDRVLAGLRAMETVGAMSAVLPELDALEGVEQSRYHHLDVHEHTYAVLGQTVELVREPASVFPGSAAGVSEVLSEPLANELTRGQALRFGALLHDIAKPATRAITDQGRVTFMGHDALGAEVSSSILTRLRASERLSEYVAALARHHLRLGFLVHEVPLSRRSIYRYLKMCSPVEVEVTVLSVADRLATRGRGSEEAIAKHLTLARRIMDDALAWRRQPPRPPVRGDELARAAGVAPGPELGRVLAELEEASFAGEIADRAQALDRGRELLRTGMD